MTTSVYPRWRGEHISSRTRASFRLGLSPLARGTHTPLSNSCDLPTVYPRWRGEHIDPEQQYAQTDGLSPLARGTLLCRFHITGLPRFIPAGAGNTYIRAKNNATATVYPRWRGEHSTATPVANGARGLSPLARGTRRDYSKEDAGDRFIPAGAGNTFKYVYLLIAISGLSPLARGTPALFAALSLVARFIPAGAGNTRTRRSSSRKNAVYPRWRGEHC